VTSRDAAQGLRFARAKFRPTALEPKWEPTQ
jgi:hypothetical protein